MTTTVNYARATGIELQQSVPIGGLLGVFGEDLSSRVIGFLNLDPSLSYGHWFIDTNDSLPLPPPPPEWDNGIDADGKRPGRIFATYDDMNGNWLGFGKWNVVSKVDCAKPAHPWKPKPPNAPSLPEDPNVFERER